MGSLVLHRNGVAWAVGLGAVAVTALVIRLAYLGAEPFWLDEAYTQIFADSAPRELLTSYAKDIHPPLYGVLTHGWQAAVGSSEEALRAFSSLWSVIGLLVAAFLTFDLTGSRFAALMSALLLAVNPLDIYYAREARMYAQAAALMTMGLWVLWRWVRDDPSPGARRRLATAYGALAAALLFTHYVAAVVVACQGLAAVTLFALRKRWRDTGALLAAGAAVSAVLLPWVVFVYRQRDGLYSQQHLGWMPPLRLSGVVGYLNHEFFLGLAKAPASAAGWFTVVAGCLLGAVVVAAASVGPHAAADASRQRPQAIALLLWLAVGPALLAAAVSASWKPIYYPPRFSLFCLTPTVVAVVVLLARVRPPLRTALVASIAALMATGAGWQAGSSIKWGMPELRRLAETRGEPEFVVVIPAICEALPHYYLPKAVIQPSAETLRTRLSKGGPATVWVCLRDGKIPPRGTPDGDFVAWLATSGSYQLLGHPDGMKVYELLAAQVPPLPLPGPPPAADQARPVPGT